MGVAGAPASTGLRVAVLAGAAALLLSGLGNVDAWAPDEPRYLQVAEELRATGGGAWDRLLLRLNGEVYDQKPPLYFWLAALSGAPFGRVTESAARLPSALAGIALVALTLALGTRLFGGRVAVLGAALMLTLAEFARNARRVQLDVLLAAFEAAALMLFWRIDRGIGPRRAQLALLHAALGLAVLTKGPVGFLVPVLVMAAYLAWERRLRELPRWLPAWGLLLSVGPALAWLAAASALAPSGFADDVLGPNLVGRFFSGTSHARPFYYFGPTYIYDCLPWTLLWPVVFLAGRRLFATPPGAAAGDGERRRAWRFLLAWVGASLLFFSLSSGKRGIYLLPTYPAMALLCADAVVSFLAGRTRVPWGLAAAGASLAAFFALLGVEVVLAAATGEPPLLSAFAPAELQKQVGDWLGVVERPLLLAFGCGLVGLTLLACVAWVVLRRHRTAPLLHVVVAVVAVAGIELAAFLLLFPAANALRSPHPIARAAAQVTPVGRPIGLVGDRAMLGGLAYYGERPVESLLDEQSLTDFVRDGDATLVVKTRKLYRITNIVPVEVLARARTGRRELLVVRPSAAPTETPAAAPETDGAVRRRTAP